MINTCLRSTKLGECTAENPQYWNMKPLNSGGSVATHLAPYLIDLPEFPDGMAGSLGVVEYESLPFKPERVFYQYDISEGASRGGHAHFSLEQFIVCLAGELRVDCIGGYGEQIHKLRRRSEGLYVPPMTWVNLTAITSATVVLVLASAPFDEADYIRNAARFLSLISHKVDADGHYT